MSLKGIDAVVFGVADMAEAKRFLDDWGVTMVVVEAREIAMADRLAAASWRSVYADSDGSVMVAPDR